jgi:hypothetical protein
VQHWSAPIACPFIISIHKILNNNNKISASYLVITFHEGDEESSACTWTEIPVSEDVIAKFDESWCGVW